MDHQQTLQLLRSHGVVLLRDFKADSQGFVAFTERFCDRFLHHTEPALRPTRRADGTLVGVLVGNGAVSLHAEMNYRPVRPDVLWLHCTQPAARGGETLVADSRRVLAALSSETRRLFERKRIRYRYVIEPASWRRVSPFKRRSMVIAFMNLMRRNLTAREAKDDAIEIDFVTEAIRPTGRDAAPGFINSIENALEYQLQVTFADGEPISAAVLDEIGRAGTLCAEPICWEQRDIVMIDNSRVMHGRRSFQGEKRVIDVRFGMLAGPSYAKGLRLRARALLAGFRRPSSEVKLAE